MPLCSTHPSTGPFAAARQQRGRGEALLVQRVVELLAGLVQRLAALLRRQRRRRRVRLGHPRDLQPPLVPQRVQRGVPAVAHVGADVVALRLGLLQALGLGVHQLRQLGGLRGLVLAQLLGRIGGQRGQLLVAHRCRDLLAHQLPPVAVSDRRGCGTTGPPVTSSSSGSTTSGRACTERSKNSPRCGRGDHLTGWPAANWVSSWPCTSKASHAPMSSTGVIPSAAFNRCTLRHQPMTCTPCSGPCRSSRRNSSNPLTLVCGSFCSRLLCTASTPYRNRKCGAPERSSKLRTTLDSRAGNSAAVAVPTWCPWRRSTSVTCCTSSALSGSSAATVSSASPGACWRAKDSSAAPSTLAASRRTEPSTAMLRPGARDSCTAAAAPSTSMVCPRTARGAGLGARKRSKSSSADSFGSRAPSNKRGGGRCSSRCSHILRCSTSKVSLPVASGIRATWLPCLTPDSWLTTACQRGRSREAWLCSLSTRRAFGSATRTMNCSK